MNSTESDEAYVSAVESGKDTPGPTYQVALELCGAWRRLRKSNAEKDKQIAVMVEASNLVVKVAAIGIPGINKLMAEVEEKSGRDPKAYYSGEAASLVMQMCAEMNDTILNLMAKTTDSKHTYDEMMARERGKWCEDFLKVCEDIVVEVPQLPSSWIGFVKDAIERMVEAEKGRGCE